MYCWRIASCVPESQQTAPGASAQGSIGGLHPQRVDQDRVLGGWAMGVNDLGPDITLKGAFEGKVGREKV